jgi:hypothetical protein
VWTDDASFYGREGSSDVSKDLGIASKNFNPGECHAWKGTDEEWLSFLQILIREKLLSSTHA